MCIASGGEQLCYVSSSIYMMIPQLMQKLDVGGKPPGA